MKNSLTGTLFGPAVAGVLVSVAPLVFSSLLTYITIANEPVIAELTGLQWLALTFLCCLTSALALTPPTFLALVFGYFLGWQALLPLFTLNMTAIFLVYKLVHWVDQDRFVHFLERYPKARTVLDRIHEQELKVIFFTKLSPVLPFAVTNLVFALSGARLRTILLGGFLGMVPRTVLAVWTGRQGREIRALLEDPNGGSWSQVAIGALILVSVIGLFSVLSGTLRR